ncbi:MAG: thiocillin family RiPP [Thiohalobacteraceae bacterium]
MFDSKKISHEFDLSASSDIELMSRTQYFAVLHEEEKAIDTFGTLGSAGTLGGCFGCLGTAGCCC